VGYVGTSWGDGAACWLCGPDTSHPRVPSKSRLRSLERAEVGVHARAVRPYKVFRESAIDKGR